MINKDCDDNYKNCNNKIRVNNTVGDKFDVKLGFIRVLF